ncbi:diffusible signal factor-reguated Ax21 faimly protein [Pseudoxanthomonas japonensis]|uniref:outer membrane beta-barrel protein n=1 Tax=Pseudoxanthomonas japonensis TaxID=69284 RepID=UPI001BCB3D93|nr:diffusible signal factor-reguated Ax21 faimly protein [Pseudoxanthomonas japonensis]MCR6625522.1 outer membrane beta-barrel protein [Pseudoxanthomonas sp.]
MKKSLLALTLLATAPFAASAAEGVSYNYVEGGYTASNLSNGIPDADGWGVKGSVAIAPNFHVFGDYASQEFDNTNFDVDNWRVGLGYNHEISQRVDLLTRVAYERYELPGDNLTGYSAEVGVNSALTNRLTGYALAGYEDTDWRDGEFYGRLGAQVKFNPNWSASADVKLIDGDTQWFVGPRFSW